MTQVAEIQYDPDRPPRLRLSGLCWATTVRRDGWANYGKTLAVSLYGWVIVLRQRTNVGQEAYSLNNGFGSCGGFRLAVLVPKSVQRGQLQKKSS
jgi:hypothetical protein